jgi:hypothetical protein
MVFVDFRKGFAACFTVIAGRLWWGEADLLSARFNFCELFYAEEAPFLARL